MVLLKAIGGEAEIRPWASRIITTAVNSLGDTRYAQAKEGTKHR